MKPIPSQNNFNSAKKPSMLALSEFELQPLLICMEKVCSQSTAKYGDTGEGEGVVQKKQQESKEEQQTTDTNCKLIKLKLYLITASARSARRFALMPSDQPTHDPTYSGEK